MAYAHPDHSGLFASRGRLVTLGAVAAIHLAAFYAIVSGLTVAFTPIFNPPPLSTHNEPLPKALPTPDHPQPRPIDRLDHPLDLPLPLPSDSITLVPLGQPTGEWRPDTLPRPLETPASEPTGHFVTPVLARPRSAPGDWVSPDDYPMRDLREGHTGMVGFRLAISADGRVTGCTVTRSSGWPGLDDATCRLVSARAKFAPATDSTGAATAGSYATNVRWQIPD